MIKSFIFFSANNFKLIKYYCFFSFLLHVYIYSFLNMYVHVLYFHNNKIDRNKETLKIKNLRPNKLFVRYQCGRISRQNIPCVNDLNSSVGKASGGQPEG